MATNPKDDTTPTTTLLVPQVADEFRSLKTRINFLEQQALRAPGVETLLALGNAAARANQLLGFNALGQPAFLAAPSGTAADVLVQLADGTNPSKGAGAVGFLDTTGYSVGSVGAELLAVRTRISSAVATFTGTNKIINGDMRFSQRATSFSGITNVGGTLTTLDRWRMKVGLTPIVAVSQYPDSPVGQGFPYSLLMTVATADPVNNTCAIRQSIEGANLTDIVGKPFTVSFWVKASKTGTYSVGFKNTGTSDSYVADYTINAANTWEKKSITINAGLPATAVWEGSSTLGLLVSFNLGASAADATAPGVWNTTSKFVSTNQVNMLDLVGATFQLTGVQLEAGTQATPFERIPVQAALAACQRFYTKVTGYPVGYAMNGSITSSVIALPTEMRGAPSLLSGGTYTTSTGAAGTMALAASTQYAMKVWNSANNWTTNTDVYATAAFELEL